MLNQNRFIDAGRCKVQHFRPKADKWDIDDIKFEYFNSFQMWARVYIVKINTI
jgi:hypothetical protein